jgi:hypothetical protein
MALGSACAAARFVVKLLRQSAALKRLSAWENDCDPFMPDKSIR